jgi:Uma2 family endonuclease
MQKVPVLSNSEIQEDRPMPSRNHGRVAQNLGVALNGLQERFDIYQQLSLDLGGWQTIPDIVLFPRGKLSNDWLTDEDPITETPTLVIEILSPMQNIQPLVDKVREYLRHGVQSCWLVEPATRVVSVFPAAGGSRGFTEGMLRDDVLAIELPLAAIFR